MYRVFSHLCCCFPELGYICKPQPCARMFSFMRVKFNSISLSLQIFIWRCQAAEKELPHSLKIANFQMFMTSHQENNQELEKISSWEKKNQANQRVGLLPFLYFSIPLSGKDIWMLQSRSLHRFVFIKREIVPTMKTRNSFGIPSII